MDLSIIITSYNTKDLTTDCIESIVKSKPKAKYEVIMVDNRSTDGSVKAARDLRVKGLSLKIIENKSNLGFSKANNRGINKARGKYVLLLNSDTVVKKGTLDRLVEFARNNLDAGVVGPRLLNHDGSIQQSVFRFPTIWRAIDQYWLGNKNSLNKYVPSGKKATEVDAVVGAAFLITPNALEKVKGLDERYFMFFEDLDYCRRIGRIGLKTYYLPEVEVVHLHGASGKDAAGEPDQWRRLIPSSKIYHGLIKHYVFNYILWSGQKFLGYT